MAAEDTTRFLISKILEESDDEEDEIDQIVYTNVRKDIKKINCKYKSFKNLLKGGLLISKILFFITQFM